MSESGKIAIRVRVIFYVKLLSKADQNQKEVLKLRVALVPKNIRAKRWLLQEEIFCLKTGQPIKKKEKVR